MNKRINIKFKKELISLINRYSLENGSNTPDFILAEYLISCLKAFNISCTKREKLRSSALNNLMPLD